MASPIDEDYLIQAARRRVLSQLEREDDTSSIINNIYGGREPDSQSRGMAESMGGEDPYDYFVNIKKRDIRGDPTIDPETGAVIEEGKVLGWDKDVHRFRSEKTPRGAYKKKR